MSEPKPCLVLDSVKLLEKSNLLGVPSLIPNFNTYILVATSLSQSGQYGQASGYIAKACSLLDNYAVTEEESKLTGVYSLSSSLHTQLACLLYKIHDFTSSASEFRLAASLAQKSEDTCAWKKAVEGWIRTCDAKGGPGAENEKKGLERWLEKGMK